VADALDSLPSRTPVQIVRWSLYGQTVERHADQAEVFARNPRVVGVVGHAGSRDALIGATIYNRDGVPQIVPNATTRQLSSFGPWTFMMVPDDSVEGDFLAQWAVDSARARRVAVMYLGDEYGVGLRNGVRMGLVRRGQELVDETVIPSFGCGLPAAMIVRAMLERARPDAVVVAGSSPSGWCVIRNVHAVDSTVWMLGADGVEVGARAPEGGYNPARVRGVGFWEAGDDSLSSALIARSQRVLGRSPSAADALMFDAFLLMHHAIQVVGPDRDAIRRYLQSLGQSREPWLGVTGPVAFNRVRATLLRMELPESLAATR
jgi:branched-chain amino acid transport system substrate-binding protein